MRVLIISQHYFPEPVEKVHDLAIGLKRMGHEVSVLTGFPCYPIGKTYSGYKQSWCGNEVIDGIPVARVPQIPDHSSSVIKRLLYYGSFAISATIQGFSRAKNADVIYFYQAALPPLFSGVLLSKMTKTPIVVDVVDLWPESVSATTNIKNIYFFKVIEQVANWLYNRCSKISVVTNGFKQKLLDRGVCKEKIEMNYHWMPGYYSDRRLSKNIKNDNHEFNIVYAGAIGVAQGLEVIVHAAYKTKNHPKLKWSILGSGTEEDKLRNKVKELELANIEFCGRVNQSDVPDYLTEADALLVHLKSSELSVVSIPSKTYSYLASGRPIIMGVEGEASRLIEDNGCGITIQPECADSLAKAALFLAEMSLDNIKQYSKACIELYKNNYTSKIGVQRIESLLSEAINHHERWNN